MRFNTKKILSLATILLAGGMLMIQSSCTAGFESINRPGGKLSEEEMGRDNFKMGAFFPNMSDIAFPAQENSYQMNENLIGAQYSRYMMFTKPSWSTSNFLIYNAPSGWINHPFQDLMSKFYSAWNEVHKMTEGKGVNYAWSQILRVIAMQRLTDQYGPIPYRGVEDGNISTAYDSQEDVYKYMFDDLNEAIDVITSFSLANPENRSMASFDKLYAGDFKKWVVLANSQKLRMAIRISEANPELAKEMAEQAVNHPIGVMTSNSDNANYRYSKNPLEVMWNSYGDTRAAADITAYMNGFKDPRIEKYLQPMKFTFLGSVYQGNRSGINVNNIEISSSYSSPKVSTMDPVLWMSVAEVSFCRAEGALRGWNMGGSAKELYELAIRQSFEQWGASGADDYINNSTLTQADYTDPSGANSIAAVSKITIKWNDAASLDEKMERLITQKWIALWPLGTEAWSEKRRTGFPKYFPLGTPNLPEVANRIPFAPDEYLNNRENVIQAVSLLEGDDNYQTKIWWQKKN